ncbi:hypothetical protein CV102_23340 [Natronococcus pandeyae]|uniref:Protein-glutamine gamma-glutamyltransferase-like C-terminal domain-containing protein n=1 Tax=Natronococcus pandeyae TaxID=2055836 RepID=A0A8J8TPU6_9EURY|nr:DUF4129 domain-containing protein [Natronococcus pandeyae]TYL36220.1 hypothetical protein CV102_23340 [Natronococcus pandeyae]
MSRKEPFVRLVAAVAAIVAIALAAATVRSPLETSGSGGAGGGDGDGSGAGQPPPADPPVSGEIPPFLEYLVYVVVALLAVVVVWYLLANRREAVKLIAIGLLVALVTVVLAYGIMNASDLLLSSNATPQEPANESPGLPGDGGEPGSGDDGSSMPTSPLLVVLALLAAVFVGGVLLSRDSGGTDELSEPNAVAPTAEDADAAAVGSAAGRAADRIDEGTAVDNEVYRAWREMTTLLEVERPESSTPREFADAAVDAGLERDHVEELTRLFEDVRYGDVETTAAMEERAVSVLRRIETEYARDESESADTGDDRTLTDGGGST